MGALLGVAQQTVASWFSSNTSDGNATKAPTPDARVKLSTPKAVEGTSARAHPRTTTPKSSATVAVQ